MTIYLSNDQDNFMSLSHVSKSNKWMIKMKKIYTAVKTQLVENLLTMLQGDNKVKDVFWQLDWPFVFW